MANARGPWYVRINYHSLYAPHSMTINTAEWSPTASTGGHGQFINWNAVGTDAVAMIEALVDVLVQFFPASVTFDNWQVFNQPLDPGPSFPRDGKAFTGKVGTAATPGWSKAVEATFNYRSTGFGAVKLVLLDMASLDNFDKTFVPTGDINDVSDVFTALIWGWAGRDNLRPATFVSVTKTLNEKLRKSYRSN